MGITAGWILLTTYGVLLWSRTATANMENMTTIILALAWCWARRERQNCFTFLVFYLICFMGAQTKGLTAVVVPILAVLPDLLRERRWRAFLSFSHLLALAVGVFVYLAPFIYSAMTRGEYQSSGLALMFRENILRYFRPFDHKEPFYVYLYYLPGLFLPWTPLLLIAFWRTFASFGRLDRRTRWLAEAVVIIFLFFTFSGSRRGYYILPILPLCALLVSVFLNTEGKKQQRHLGHILQTGLFIIISIVEILSLVIWPIIRARVGFIPPEDLKLAAPVLGLLALFPWILNRLRPGLQGGFLGINSKDSPCVVSAVILMGGFFCWQQVSVDAYRQERPFAMELKARIAGLSPEQIAFYGTCKSYILFYLDLPGPVRILSDNESVRNYLESARGDKCLITKRKYLKDLESAFPARLKGQPTLSEKIYPWDRKINKKLVAFEIKAVENKDEQKDNRQNAPGRL